MKASENGGLHKAADSVILPDTSWERAIQVSGKVLNIDLKVGKEFLFINVLSQDNRKQVKNLYIYWKHIKESFRNL